MDWDSLTPTEKDIAWLAADGDSNRQIATILSLPKETVDERLRQVLAKFGLRSRGRLKYVAPPIEESTEAMMENGA